MSEVEDSVENEGPSVGLENEHQQVVSENNDSAEQVPTEQTKQAEVQKLLKKFKLKVDGHEYEEEIDLNDEARIIRALQMEAVSGKRLKEAQEEKRKAYELAQALETKTKDYLKQRKDGKQIAEELLLEQMMEEQMSPQERQYREMAARLEAYERAEKAQKEAEEQAKVQAAETKMVEKMQSDIISALEKANAPKTAQATRRMAEIWQQSINLGLDLDVNDLAAYYKRETAADLAHLLKGTSIEQAYELIPKEFIKDLRSYDVKNLKQQQKALAKQQHEMKMPSPPTKGRDYMTPDEAIEYYRKRVKDLAD